MYNPVASTNAAATAMSTSDAITIVLSLIGASSVPLVVGFFVHVGVRSVKKPMAPIEFQGRLLLIQNAAYFVLWIASIGALFAFIAVTIFDGTNSKPYLIWVVALLTQGLWIFDFIVLVGYGALEKNYCFADAVRLMIALIITPLPLLGWSFIAGAVYNGWIGSNASNPYGLPLWLVLYSLAPLMYMTLVVMSHFWGITFASFRYKERKVSIDVVVNGTASSVEGIFVSQMRGYWVLLVNNQTILIADQGVRQVSFQT